MDLKALDEKYFEENTSKEMGINNLIKKSFILFFIRKGY